VIVADTLDLAGRVSDASAGWVTPRSLDGVRQALDESLSNPAESRARGRCAQALAGDYRWASVATRLEAMYASVATGQRAEPARADAASANAVGRN
jgi:glycosyltransferase involved in cell wall biosynthesis